jgi:molecular chaperone GrpE
MINTASSKANDSEKNNVLDDTLFVEVPTHPSEKPEAEHHPLEGLVDSLDTTPPQTDRVAELEADVATLKDRLVRSLADLENMRRRTEREVKDARLYGATAFARDILTVADNIQRAQAALPEAERANLSEAVKAFLEGIELTERDLLKTLERHNVKQLQPMGQKFDPNKHQAMFEAPTNDVEPGTVMNVIQTGYTIGERVLRPALVGVAKAASNESAA